MRVRHNGAMRPYAPAALVSLLAASCAAGSSVAGAPADSAALSVSAGHLPFIEDDYGRAMVEARARHVPIFVDVWAPW